VSRTKCVPLKIVYGADVSAGTPFLSFTEYLHAARRKCFQINGLQRFCAVGARNLSCGGIREDLPWGGSWDFFVAKR